VGARLEEENATCLDVRGSTSITGMELATGRGTRSVLDGSLVSIALIDNLPMDSGDPDVVTDEDQALTEAARRIPAEPFTVISLVSALAGLAAGFLRGKESGRGDRGRSGHILIDTARFQPYAQESRRIDRFLPSRVLAYSRIVCDRGRFLFLDLLQVARR
jgi:hypothetical protein